MKYVLIKPSLNKLKFFYAKTKQTNKIAIYNIYLRV